MRGRILTPILAVVVLFCIALGIAVYSNVSSASTEFVDKQLESTLGIVETEATERQAGGGVLNEAEYQDIIQGLGVSEGGVLVINENGDIIADSLEVMTGQNMSAQSWYLEALQNPSNTFRASFGMTEVYATCALFDGKTIVSYLPYESVSTLFVTPLYVIAIVGGVGVIAIGFIITLIVSRLMVKPLEAFEDQIDEFVFTHEIDVSALKGCPEIAAIGEQLNGMQKQPHRRAFVPTWTSTAKQASPASQAQQEQSASAAQKHKKQETPATQKHKRQEAPAAEVQETQAVPASQAHQPETPSALQEQQPKTAAVAQEQQSEVTSVTQTQQAEEALFAAQDELAQEAPAVEEYLAQETSEPQSQQQETDSALKAVQEKAALAAQALRTEEASASQSVQAEAVLASHSVQAESIPEAQPAREEPVSEAQTAHEEPVPTPQPAQEEATPVSEPAQADSAPEAQPAQAESTTTPQPAQAEAVHEMQPDEDMRLEVVGLLREIFEQHKQTIASKELKFSLMVSNDMPNHIVATKSALGASMSNMLEDALISAITGTKVNAKASYLDAVTLGREDAAILFEVHYNGKEESILLDVRGRG